MAISKKQTYALGGIVATALFAISSIIRGGNPEGSSNRRRLLNGYDDTVVTIPSYAANFANVWDPFQPTDHPIFWYLGLAGGLPFTNIAGSCLNLTQISPKGDANSTDIIPVAPVRFRPIRLNLFRLRLRPTLNTFTFF